MLKIGVLGAGHLGKIHLKCLQGLPEIFHIEGFYDPDSHAGEELIRQGMHRFHSVEELLSAVDVVDIVTPTLNHYECAKMAIAQGKHFFVEKPVTETPEQAKHLQEWAEQENIIAQVGHVERFNPAFVAAEPYLQNPMFVETHRLAEFNPRGTDVPVVLDLMIHDIDIVLRAVKAEVKSINASGVAVISDSPDIANARIEFANGCVANLTASRISLKNMRKTRLFQRDAYITIDFLEKKTEVVRMKNVQNDPEDPYAMTLELGDNKRKQIYFEQPDILVTNAIQEELRSFAQCVNKMAPVSVSLYDGYRALQVAHEIVSHINPTKI